MYFKRFIQWQNYAHYLLLGAGLFFWIKIMEFILPKLPFNGLVFNLIFITGLIIGLFILDSIVHLIFYILPRGYGQWRD